MVARLVKLELQPGVNTNDTALANEGGYVGSNWVRSWQGYAQPRGGFIARSIFPFEGVPRGAHAWSTRTGATMLAWGTSEGLLAEFNGNRRDITGPLHQTALEDAFTTRNGSPEVTVRLPYHHLVEGQEVEFSNHNGTVGSLTIEGVYEVEQVVGRDRFTIIASSNANADVDDGGGWVDFKAFLRPGLSSNRPIGYGTGGWSEGSYGSSDQFEALRVWNLANWGEFLLANASGFGLWEYQPQVSYPDLAFNGDFDGNADGWALGTGWAHDTDKVTKTAGTASNLSQNVEDVLEAGKTYRVTFTVTRTAGTVRFRMNAGLTPAIIDVGYASAPITKAGTYSRIFRCPADAIDILFEADSSFDGSISDVSYHIEDKAFRITTAPPIIDHMFVDPNGLACALGTTSPEDGQYEPSLFRCSDLGNNRAWVPDDGSFAATYPIREIGGRLIAGLATRQQNLIWADNGVCSAQFTGEVENPYVINKLGSGCGLIARHAMAEQNGFVFWASNTRQFFIFRGLSDNSLGIPEVIPCSVSEDIWNNINEIQIEKCHIGITPRYSEVEFFYPDARDGDECSRSVVFSWIEGHWHQHIIARTAWCSNGLLPNPVGFGTDGFTYDHEVGWTANGANLSSWIETGDLDIQDGDQLLKITGFVPDFKDQIGNVRVTFKGKLYPNKAGFIEKVKASSPDTTRLNFRLMARTARMRFQTVTTGGFWRMGAHKVELGQSGARR